MKPYSKELSPLTEKPLKLIDIRECYKITNILNNNPNVGNNINIGIIVAYAYYPSNKNLITDLTTYCKQYNIQFPDTNKIHIHEMYANNISDYGWGLETALDLQTIYTICPNLNIYIVQAKSSSYQDIMNAVEWASNNCNVVSMSLGSDEFAEMIQYEKYFKNTNICYFASSGDANSVSYPSSCCNICCVGGSSLQLKDDKTRLIESAWSNAGCGNSVYFKIPAYQKNNLINAKTKIQIPTTRITPDLVCNANPSCGVYIYFNNSYKIVGGTSLACPIISSFFSMVLSKRKLNKKPQLTTVYNGLNNNTNIQYLLYQIYNSPLYSKYYYDVTTGNDGRYKAILNYDYATGLGVMLYDVVFNDMTV